MYRKSRERKRKGRRKVGDKCGRGNKYIGGKTGRGPIKFVRVLRNTLRVTETTGRTHNTLLTIQNQTRISSLTIKHQQQQQEEAEQIGRDPHPDFNHILKATNYEWCCSSQILRL